MKDISIILVGTKTSGNLSAVARVMANFGVSKLLLVEPKCNIDEDARRRAKHAQEVLQGIKKKSFVSIRKNFDVLIATTGKIGTDYNINRSPILLPEINKSLSGFKGKVGLVFGSEEKGLSNEMLAKCDFALHIPSSKSYPVINLSHAVGIVLYELSKNVSLRETHKLATRLEKDLMISLLDEIIDSLKSGLPTEKETQKKVFRRIIGKSMITKRESFAVLGLLKKIRKKI